MDKTYICIDLKSFYASVECVSRNLDPLITNLIVADLDRSENTICLAVSPALKEYGIPGRARYFEIKQKIARINQLRRQKLPTKKFKYASSNANDLKNDDVEISFLVAKPRMAYYMEVSSNIYSIYLKYFSKDDIHVYSIDEVFIDATPYLKNSKLTATELVKKIVNEIYKTTGITATVGVGPNLYLAKVAMDIMAKKMKPNNNGLRIAILDEITYRKELWEHKPLTDFWRVGHGYFNKLVQNNMFTMGDIALCSLHNEDLLYELFGINAELLIDHAWGYEPCTMKEIKQYKPTGKSIGQGQVLTKPYDYKKAKIIVKEMIETLALDLCEKNLVTDQIVLNIGYDVNNLKDETIIKQYQGEIKLDYLQRKVPKPARGTINLTHFTSSSKLLRENIVKLYDKIVDKNLSIRRINVAAIHIIEEKYKDQKVISEQLNLFSDPDETKIKQNEEQEQKDIKSQKAMILIKKKYGKNAIMKGTDLQEGATGIERNKQIGGHRA